MTAARIATLLIGLTALSAQPKSPPPHFEVASLKPGQPLPPGNFNINLGALKNGTLTMTNTCLADCLRYAYQLSNNDQISAPDWVKLKTVRFDIVAKAPPDTPFDQIRLMLQTLLTERFQLAMHREQKQMSYIALVAGKNGPKLQPSVVGVDASGASFLIGHIESKRITMNTLATVLARFSGEYIVDLTGLTGAYDLKLTWAPDRKPNSAASADAPPSAENDGPSLFAAVEQQLGLKLDVRKGPIEIIVIDHAEQVPVQN